ncbi:MAG: hypothetical protein ACRDNF_20050 [Streptosporangiaceae bacterium]
MNKGRAARNTTLPDLLRHIEVGNTVLVILTPDTTPQPGQDEILS